MAALLQLSVPVRLLAGFVLVAVIWAAVAAGGSSDAAEPVIGEPTSVAEAQVTNLVVWEHLDGTVERADERTLTAGGGLITVPATLDDAVEQAAGDSFGLDRAREKTNPEPDAPAEPQPAEPQPVEPAPAESEPAASEPTASEQAASEPAESEPAESEPAGSEPAGEPTPSVQPEPTADPAPTGTPTSPPTGEPGPTAQPRPTEPGSTEPGPTEPGPQPTATVPDDESDVVCQPEPEPEPEEEITPTPTDVPTPEPSDDRVEAGDCVDADDAPDGQESGAAGGRPSGGDATDGGASAGGAGAGGSSAGRTGTGGGGGGVTGGGTGGAGIAAGNVASAAGGATTVGATTGPVLTGIAGVGDALDLGAVAWAIDAEPVAVLIGDGVWYRDLDIESTDGEDVQVLETALVALGHGEDLTVDQDFTSATAAAVLAWETELGRGEPDGQVTTDEVVLLDVEASVLRHDAVVGDHVPTGTPVLTVGGDAQVVLVPAPADQATDWTVGTPVTLQIDDVSVGTGQVASRSTAVDGGAVDQVGTRTLFIVPDADLGRRPGSVAVTVSRIAEAAESVLTVPVAAVVAGSDGQPAVRVVEGSTHTLVPVTTGVVVDGQVAVDAGLEAGATVMLPS